MKAPSLAGLYGSQVTLADGRTVTADDGWLREKILNPNGDRLAGGGKQVMPSFAGRIPADELGTLIDFLKSYAGPASGKAATWVAALTFSFSKEEPPVSVPKM